MDNNIISLNQVTKDYGKGRGIFDIDLQIKPGTVYGYIGTNGSGKTTTIRNIMGFIRPDKGSVLIKGMDAWDNATELKKYMSYIPGEIEFPRFKTGTDFLNYYAKYLGITNLSYMEDLIEILHLDPSANLRRMSKGMKQKTAVVAALMADKELLILDEPTTGLDPLMRDVFLNLIRREKAKGKTILMSSHIFEEIEEVCDVAAIIHKGKIVDEVNMEALRNPHNKKFRITFSSKEDRRSFAELWKENISLEDNPLACEVVFPGGNIKTFLQLLKNYRIRELKEDHPTLEGHFKKVIKEGEK